MKRLLPLALCLITCFYTTVAISQCTGGKIQCSINWDYLKFFPSAGLGTYTTLAQSQTQNFAFGTQKLTVAHNYTGSNALGEDVTNTAETGSNGSGADVHFVGNGQITFTFQTPVDNIKFSIYDIDRNQRMTFSTALGTIVSLSKISGSIISFTNNNTNTAQVDATSLTVGNSNTDGTMNVSITSLTSITSFTINITNTGTSTSPVENGDFWVSDISACSAGSFTANYYNVSKPFTNQPGYVVTSRQDSVYYVDPATGTAKFMFRDNGHIYLNSVAYDPVKHYVYYVYSLTNPGPPVSTNPANKSLRRYDYDKDTFGVVTNDLSNLIPIFESGVESGSAAFYDGSLYLGIEAKNTGPYESIVWKIDFDASNVPSAATQVYGVPASGHDWGDIGLTNGVLYDFDSYASGPNYFHQDLYTHNVTSFTPSGVNVPRQTAIGWNNVVYNVGGPTTTSPGTIVPYNLDGTVVVGSLDTIKFNGVSEIGSWGDAAEAFKPKVDFGDAPASYDPATGDPAVHEINPKLLLGNASDNEWLTRGQTTGANSDNYDDAITGGSLVNPSTGNFFVQVKYLNNTGQPATIAAWVDFNNNGKFDAGEGLVQNNLPSSASAQTAYFNWSGVSTTLVDGSYTYLRLRITNTSNGMTTANATGFFGDGEVEDHRIPVSKFPLETSLVKFTATKTPAAKVDVKWEVANEQANTTYTLQRSADAQRWSTVNTNYIAKASTTNNYNFNDSSPLKGTSYYRLKISNTADTYSEIRKVDLSSSTAELIPNPAHNHASVVITTTTAGAAEVHIYDAGGQVVSKEKVAVNSGSSIVSLTAVPQLPAGMYWVQVQIGTTLLTQKLIIEK